MKSTTEVVNHRGATMTEREPVYTNRQAFLDAHPEAKRVHEAHMREFREKLSALSDGLKPILHGIVDKAEQLRQLGIVLCFFCETLPGGRLTRDLYEQHKHEFVDARGQSVQFELLEWSIKVARENLEPIDNLHQALKYRQPLLVATGELSFVLESAPPPQKSVPPPDLLNEMKKLLNPAALPDVWARLRCNQNYFTNGRLRETLRATLVEELAPTFRAVDEIKRELGIA